MVSIGLPIRNILKCRIGCQYHRGELIVNIDQQIVELQNQINALQKLRSCRDAVKYPIYKQHKSSKQIVKFTRLQTGTVVVKGREKHHDDVGFSSNEYIPHTHTGTWVDILFDEKAGIVDKQLCECWNDCSFTRSLCFYDAANKCTFTETGSRNGCRYDNYQPIAYVDYPRWAIEAKSTLDKITFRW